MKTEQSSQLTCAWDDPFHPAQIASFRRMTTRQKLDALAQMVRAARWLLASQIRRHHPEWDADTIQREVSRRFAHGTS